MRRLWRPWHQATPLRGDMDREDAAMGAGQASCGSPEQRGTRGEPPGWSDPEKASLLARRIDGWLASMERLRLAEYVRYVDDRKRLFWTSFMGGVARGVGMAVGFTILGALLVLVLQDLAKRNLPLIGDVLAQIVSVVQNRLQ